MMTNNVLRSPEVSQECNDLVKKLWKNLVNDPDTLASIIVLLSESLKDPKIKAAASNLVVDLCSDAEVIAGATQLVSKLGLEDDVLNATSEILTSSSHNVLNDPGILSHSKEFMTDVIADDSVQRSSGDALWKTITYSVRPGTVSVLSGLGAGFILVGVFALNRGGFVLNGGNGVADIGINWSALENMKWSDVGGSGGEGGGMGGVVRGASKGVWAVGGFIGKHLGHLWGGLVGE